jgi:hypothetical protein
VKKKKAYICSPLLADTPAGIRENMKKANQYAKEISELLRCKATAVHGILPELLDDNDPAERTLALDFGKKYLATCDMLVVCGNRISSGMAGEIKAALKLGIPIYAYANGSICYLQKGCPMENGKLPVSYTKLFIHPIVIANISNLFREEIDLDGLQRHI